MQQQLLGLLKVHEGLPAALELVQRSTRVQEVGWHLGDPPPLHEPLSFRLFFAFVHLGFIVLRHELERRLLLHAELLPVKRSFVDLRE